MTLFSEEAWNYTIFLVIGAANSDYQKQKVGEEEQKQRQKEEEEEKQKQKEVEEQKKKQKEEEEQKKKQKEEEEQSNQTEKEEEEAHSDQTEEEEEDEDVECVMSDDEELVLDEICTLCTAVDGLVEYLQSSSEKVIENIDINMASPNGLNLKSENIEEIDDVVLICTSTTHSNDQEQWVSSTSNVLQQQYENNFNKVTFMTFV